MPDADPPPTPPPPLIQKKKGGQILLAGVVILVSANALIAFARSDGSHAFRLGAAFSQLLIPFLIALVLSAVRRFRSARAWIKVFLWVSVGLLVAKVGSQGVDDGRRHYRQGVALYNSREYEKAAAEITKALRSRSWGTPSKVDVLMARGLAWAQVGNDAAAIADIRAVLEADPHNAAATDLLAGLIEAVGNTNLRAAPAGAWPEVLKKTAPLTRRDVPALISALTSAVPRIRWEAVTALGNLGPAARQALPALRRVEAQDPEAFIRASARAAMADTGNSDAPPER